MHAIEVVCRGCPLPSLKLRHDSSISVLFVVLNVDEALLPWNRIDPQTTSDEDEDGYSMVQILFEMVPP